MRMFLLALVSVLGFAISADAVEQKGFEPVRLLPDVDTLPISVVSIGILRATVFRDTTAAITAGNYDWMNSWFNKDWCK